MKCEKIEELENKIEELRRQLDLTTKLLAKSMLDSGVKEVVLPDTFHAPYVGITNRLNSYEAKLHYVPES